jgi:hypothetical protein
MIAQGNVDTGPPTADAISAFDEALLDRQRSGAGILTFMLFPMISIAAIAFAAFELIR